MNAGFRQFMTGLVDYAGLFPPASLDMPTAVANYHRYRGQPESWMLGGFICPAARLQEMTGCLPEGFADKEPWECSVLIGGKGNTGTVLAALPRQLQQIQAVEEAHGGRLRAPALEMPLPLVAVPEATAFLGRVQELLQSCGLENRLLYCEIPATADPATDAAMLAAIKSSGLRAKFRCGGVTPEAFPSVDRLAGIIQGAAALDLPLKCTAGLHHPIRHQSVQPAVMMHGFINVFGAGLLACALDLDAGLIRECVAETDPEAFGFSPAGFCWREHLVAADQAADIRTRILPGFGSCSFDEPRADLRQLGLLN